MNSYEHELLRIQPVIERLIRLFLFGKRVEVYGRENLISSGPNIIVGNHIGSYKDIAVLFKIAHRTLYFTSNRMIFNRDDFNFLIRKHLRRHMKDFGVFLYKIMAPFRVQFVEFISSNIAKIGTIPVDLSGTKRHAISSCQEYVRKGRTVVLLQGRGRVQDTNPHPYVSPFRKGPAIIAHNLLRECDLSVPVTPVAMFGTHLPYIVPGKILVNIGSPMYIKDYINDDFLESVNRFRWALEKRVKSLLYELIKPKM